MVLCKSPLLKAGLVCRLPALVHQYFNAQQCEDMPAGLSLYGNLAAPLPQHMAAIRQSLVNDHAMYLEEVHQRLAALLPPSAAGMRPCAEAATSRTVCNRSVQQPDMHQRTDAPGVPQHSKLMILWHTVRQQQQT